jgi:hypothetical protein
MMVPVSKPYNGGVERSVVDALKEIIVFIVIPVWNGMNAMN